MEEKEEYPVPQTKPIPWRERLAKSRPWVYCRNHKRIVIPIIMLLLLLPLLGLIALKDRHKARAEATSPIVYPSREYCFTMSTCLLTVADSVQPWDTEQATGQMHMTKHTASFPT